jgi:hypothetical protein
MRVDLNVYQIDGMIFLNFVLSNYILISYPNRLMNPTSSNANPRIDFPIRIKNIPNRNKIIPGIRFVFKKNEFLVAGLITSIIPGTNNSWIVQ